MTHVKKVSRHGLKTCKMIIVILYHKIVFFFKNIVAEMVLEMLFFV